MYSMHRLTFDSQLRLVSKPTIFCRGGFLAARDANTQTAGFAIMCSLLTGSTSPRPPPYAVSPKMCLHTAGLKADKVKGLVNL